MSDRVPSDCLLSSWMLRNIHEQKGIITLRGLKPEESGVITGFQIMASASFTPKENFQLMAIIDAIPMQWRHHSKTCNNYQNNSLISNSAQLHLHENFSLRC